MKLYVRPHFVAQVVIGDIQCAIRPGSRWRAGLRADIFAREEKPRLLFRAPVVKVQTLSIKKNKYFLDGKPMAFDDARMGWIFGLAGLPSESRWVGLFFLRSFPFSGQVIYWSHFDRFFDTKETKKHIAAALARPA